jgi:hypothetical protein
LRHPSLLEQNASDLSASTYWGLKKTSSAPDTCSSLTNQSGNINFYIPSQCNKASDDLSRNVPVNLKQKIIAGKYIDLALLLSNSQASLSDKHTLFP